MAAVFSQHLQKHLIMTISTLGIIHTIIGITALIAAIVSYARFSRINLSVLSGAWYFWGTLVASFTALGLSKKGGFQPGHIFSLFIVVLVLIAAWLHYRRPVAARARYAENFLLSFSFLLSLVPTINETFTRVPVGHPIASGPTDPLIAKTLLGLLVLFVIGSVGQFRLQRKINRLP